MTLQLSLKVLESQKWSAFSQQKRASCLKTTQKTHFSRCLVRQFILLKPASFSLLVTRPITMTQGKECWPSREGTRIDSEKNYWTLLIWVAGDIRQCWQMDLKGTGLKNVEYKIG